MTCACACACACACVYIGYDCLVCLHSLTSSSPLTDTPRLSHQISSVIRNSTTIHLTVALVSTLLDVASVVTALVLFHIIRTRLLRRQAYRTLKSKLFTMITDLSTSIMLFVSPAPPPPQPAESSSDDVNLGKHKPQKQRRRSTQSSP